MFNNKKTQKGQKSEEKCRKKKQEKFEEKKKSVIYILKLHAQGWESHI